MKLTQTPQFNDVLRAPPGATIEECRPAPIVRGEYPNGQKIVATFWMPDAEELAALNRGEPVQVIIWGVTMPPVCILVGSEVK